MPAGGAHHEPALHGHGRPAPEIHGHELHEVHSLHGVAGHGGFPGGGGGCGCAFGVNVTYITKCNREYKCCNNTL